MLVTRGRPRLVAGSVGQGEDIDRYVGARIRDRRVVLGLTQQAMSELIGVTYQQARKYETGINRVAAGRLHAIAEALHVDVAYFYEGVRQKPKAPGPQQRLTLELARNFIAIENHEHQGALVALARAMAAGHVGEKGSE